MELTEKAIKSAKPGAVLKDDTVRGLQLRVREGGASFLFYYRTKAGQERRPKIGDYGAITLTQARNIAKEWAGMVAAGRDPYAEMRVVAKEPLFSELWADYWENHGQHKKSSAFDQDSYTNHLAPRFAHKRLSDIGYSEVAAMMKAMADKPYAANRCLALLSVMFNRAIQPLEWMAKNPVKGVTRYKEVARERYMDGDETTRIAQALAEQGHKTPASVAFIYLLILTGARSGEIAAAQWRWVKGNTIEFPDSKTGKKTVYLPPQAIEVLNRLPRTNGTITGIKSPKKIWAQVRVKAGCPDLRLHDLRHSFASAALASGLSLTQIGELLGHRSVQTTKRYAHLEKAVGVAAATQAADRISLHIKSPVI